VAGAFAIGVAVEFAFDVSRKGGVHVREDAVLEVVRLQVFGQARRRVVDGSALVALVALLAVAEVAEGGAQVGMVAVGGVETAHGSGAQVEAIAAANGQVGAVGGILSVEGGGVVAVISVGFRRSVGIFHHRSRMPMSVHSAHS